MLVNSSAVIAAPQPGETREMTVQTRSKTEYLVYFEPRILLSRANCFGKLTNKGSNKLRLVWEGGSWS